MLRIWFSLWRGREDGGRILMDWRPSCKGFTANSASSGFYKMQYRICSRLRRVLRMRVAGCIPELRRSKSQSTKSLNKSNSKTLSSLKRIERRKVSAKTKHFWAPFSKLKPNLELWAPRKEETAGKSLSKKDIMTQTLKSQQTLKTNSPSLRLCKH